MEQGVGNLKSSGTAGESWGLSSVRTISTCPNLYKLCITKNPNCVNELTVKLLPQLLSTEDVSRAEEGDAREPQVLVQHEYSYWDEVGVTQVVNEAADVTIVASVDTIHFPILDNKKQMLYFEKKTLVTFT